MSGKPWTDRERDQLRAAYPTVNCREIAAELGRTERAVYSQAKLMGLSKAEGHAARAGRIGAQHPRAIETRFKAGITPWNKGGHYTAGGRSVETQFKQGHRPHTWKPIGSERISKDGYLQRKVTDTGYTPRDWVAVHHLIWIEAGRAIPKGHALVFKDGDKRNITLENLELVARADLMRRNTRHNLPPELNQLIGLRAALVRKINNRTKDAE
jgi:hypothetical protein